MRNLVLLQYFSKIETEQKNYINTTVLILPIYKPLTGRLYRVNRLKYVVLGMQRKNN